jgi:hypothetical protein
MRPLVPNDKSRVVRHRHIHDPGIQQEPKTDAAGVDGETPFSRGPDGMPLLAALTVSRVEYHRRRQLIRDSRALIASVKAVSTHARQSMVRLCLLG